MTKIADPDITESEQEFAVHLLKNLSNIESIHTELVAFVQGQIKDNPVFKAAIDSYDVNLKFLKEGFTFNARKYMKGGEDNKMKLFAEDGKNLKSLLEASELEDISKAEFDRVVENFKKRAGEIRYFILTAFKVPNVTVPVKGLEDQITPMRFLHRIVLPSLNELEIIKERSSV